MERRNSIADLGDPLTLSYCRELRELEIDESCPRIVELNVISSITSTKIQKIKFTRPLSPGETPVSDHPNWTLLDDSLCRLVDQPENGHRLEVEFQAFQEWWGGELGLKKYLPRFYEKGGTGGGRGG